MARVLAVTRRLPDRTWSRAVSSVCRRLLGDVGDGPIDTEVYSFRMRLHPEDNLCEKRVLFAPQSFDPAERKFLAETLDCGSTFIDVGANAGVYSLFVAQTCSDRARVVAVEPDPRVRSRLEFNIRASDIGCIEVDGTAVSDRCGTIELFLNPVNRGCNSIVRQSGESIVVQAVTLRRLLDAREIERPDCIKLDIEDAEEIVLRRFFDEIERKRCPGAFILEQHRKQPLSPAVNLLLDQGYRLVQQTRMNVILTLR